MLREWQQDAKNKFLSAGKADFLVSATPGAGKTTFALDLARDMVAAGQVDQVVIVVPTDALRRHWAEKGDSFGIPLVPVDEPEDIGKLGYRGYVVTYSQVQFKSQRIRLSTRVRTLAILDEVHHAGENKAWGDGLREALGLAVYRVALTGTPWRRDKRSPIPFVEYGDDGTVRVDFAYEYGAAVADGVCRSVEFHAYDGNANWKDPALPEPLVSRDLTKVTKEDVGIALTTVFAPRSPWILTLLSKGNAALDAMREDVPDAAGLVVADDTSLARAYAAELKTLTGEEPALALYDEAGSKKAIENFAATGCRQRWIVAVRMVSEGVDIPRLAVGIYATKARTPLIFRQIVGRFTRVRTDDDPNSLLFLPAIPELMALAREIYEELRHQLEKEEHRDAPDRQQPLEFREALTASEATLDRAIFNGDDLTADELSAAAEMCRRHGIRPSEQVGVARMMRALHAPPLNPSAVAPGPQEPRHKQERLLRGQVQILSNKLAHRAGVPYKQVAIDLLAAGFPPRAKATVEDLHAMEATLVKWLAQV